MSKGLKLNEGNKKDKESSVKEVSKSITLLERLKVLFSKDNSNTGMGKKHAKNPLSKKRFKPTETDSLADSIVDKMKSSKSGQVTRSEERPKTSLTPRKTSVQTGDGEGSNIKREGNETNDSLTEIGKKTIDSVHKPKKPALEFSYLKPVRHSQEKKTILQPLIEIKSERVLTTRPKLESVRDINSIGILDRISLVTYFNDKKSGKLDERISLINHKKNTEYMERYYSLVSFIQEASIRALEHLGEYEYYLQVDSKDRDILDDVLTDANLTSYVIDIFYENTILSRLKVEPVMLRIRMKDF